MVEISHEASPRPRGGKDAERKGEDAKVLSVRTLHTLGVQAAGAHHGSASEDQGPSVRGVWLCDGQEAKLDQARSRGALEGEEVCVRSL